MYNASSIEQFIIKVQKEASEAAQKVFDKYENELYNRAKAQIKTGDKLVIGMGTAFIQAKNGNYVGEKLAIELAQTQYWSKNVEAGFSLRDFEK